MKLFHGLVIDCESIDDLRVSPNTVIVVDNDGKVTVQFCQTLTNLSHVLVIATSNRMGE